MPKPLIIAFVMLAAAGFCPAADPDNGGLPTGIEWIVGGNPPTGNPDNFIFTDKRRDPALAEPGGRLFSRLHMATTP